MIISFAIIPLMFLYYTYRTIFTLVLFAISYIGLMVIKDIPVLSIGKKILGLEIYSSGTNNQATSKQRVLRNITWVIWPIELIVLIFSSDGRRLSDKWFKTEIRSKGNIMS